MGCCCGIGNIYKVKNFVEVDCKSVFVLIDEDFVIDVVFGNVYVVNVFVSVGFVISNWFYVNVIEWFVEGCCFVYVDVYSSFNNVGLVVVLNDFYWVFLVWLYIGVVCCIVCVF